MAQVETAIDITTVPPLEHREAMDLAAAEFARMLDLLRALRPEEWRTQTACDLWDVQAMVAHVVGMAEAEASMRQFARDFQQARKRESGAMIDAMTATQVRERAHLSPAQLIDTLASVAPRAVKARQRVPAVVRWGVRMRQDPPFDHERWTFGYLVDTIFTRDVWMHRLDISRATGREMVLTAEHDGRLIADLVVDWARRHGRPFSLTLTGPAGGRWRSSEGGATAEHLELDALDFCLAVSGRAAGEGLLATPVPF